MEERGRGGERGGRGGGGEERGGGGEGGEWRREGRGGEGEGSEWEWEKRGRMEKKGRVCVKRKKGEGFKEGEGGGGRRLTTSG